VRTDGVFFKKGCFTPSDSGKRNIMEFTTDVYIAMELCNILLLPMNFVKVRAALVKQGIQ